MTKSPAGALRHYVQLQRPAAGLTALGHRPASFEPVGHVWADVRHASGLETVRANTELSAVRASVRIRRRTDVQATWRVVHGANVYEVLAVLQHEPSGAWTDLACELTTVPK
jgi:SPP1 family predicted phage head-tail adaptor